MSSFISCLYNPTPLTFPCAPDVENEKGTRLGRYDGVTVYQGIKKYRRYDFQYSKKIQMHFFLSVLRHTIIPSGAN